VIDLHGTVWQAQCLNCGARTRMVDTLARISDDVPDPSCELCGGILKSATISFGQPLDRRVIERAQRVAEDCDLLLAVGSTLQVYPAAGMCDVAVSHGARFVVVNGDATPYDAMADAVLREPISDVLPAIVRAALN
jgi:NAD-dependent deacetylase